MLPQVHDVVRDVAVQHTKSVRMIKVVVSQTKVHLEDIFTQLV